MSSSFDTFSNDGGDGYMNFDSYSPAASAAMADELQPPIPSHDFSLDDDVSIPPSPDTYGFRSDPLAGFSTEPAPASPFANGEEENGGFFASDGPVLPPPDEMVQEEGFVLREWRRYDLDRSFDFRSEPFFFPICSRRSTSLEIGSSIY